MRGPFLPHLPRRGGLGRVAAVGALGAAAAGVPLAAVAVWLLRPPAPAPTAGPSSAGGTPQVRGEPGGPNRTEELERVRVAAAARDAEAAQRDGRSYTPEMGGFETAEPGDVAPAGARPTVRLEERSATAGAAQTAAAPQPSSQAARTPTEADITAMRNAMTAALAGWRGKDGAVNVYDDSVRAGRERGARGAAAGGSSIGLTTASPGGSSNGASPGGLAPIAAPPRARLLRRVLMEAGTGVYGRIVIGGNTDQGGPPIVAEALSGPIAGHRLIGSFARQGGGNQPGALLGLRFTSISIGGRSVPVDAFAVAPDTMESAVASRVDPHTAERILLPLAASFAQGLGQALAFSGSVSTFGPFGGVGVLRRFSFPELAGIGAGSAGATAGQLLREQAPRERTVFIDAGSEIGIMFASPLVLEE